MDGWMELSVFCECLTFSSTLLDVTFLLQSSLEVNILMLFFFLVSTLAVWDLCQHQIHILSTLMQLLLDETMLTVH